MRLNLRCREYTGEELAMQENIDQATMSPNRTQMTEMRKTDTRKLSNLQMGSDHGGDSDMSSIGTKTN